MNQLLFRTGGNYPAELLDMAANGMAMEFRPDGSDEDIAQMLKLTNEHKTSVKAMLDVESDQAKLYVYKFRKADNC